MDQNLENKVRALLNKSVKAEIIDVNTKTLTDLEQDLVTIKLKIKAYNAKKRQSMLSFGETLDLNCQKHNARSLESTIYYKQAQIRANTTGPINIFDL